MARQDEAIGKLDVRKYVIQVEETLSDYGRPVPSPVRRATVVAVIANPYAGTYVDDLSPLYQLAGELSPILVEKALAALGVEGEAIDGFGKAGVAGTDGELEHIAALIHPNFGNPVRAAVKGVEAIPSAKKVGPPGTTVTVPIWSKTRLADIDHMDTAEVTIFDSPRPGELIVALTLAIGGRPLHRVKVPS